MHAKGHRGGGPWSVRAVPESDRTLPLYRRQRRPYTFDCTFNSRSGATRAAYKWTGGFSGGGYDEPA